MSKKKIAGMLRQETKSVIFLPVNKLQFRCCMSDVLGISKAGYPIGLDADGPEDVKPSSEGDDKAHWNLHGGVRHAGDRIFDDDSDSSVGRVLPP